MRSCLFYTLAFLPFCIQNVMAIGMSIPPVVTGNLKQYSSLANLMNCVSYTTSKDDIIMLNIQSGDKLSSQQLNLRVFDSEDNTLRLMHDMSGEQSVIFTNLNNPIQIPQSDSKNRIGLANRRQVKQYQDDPDVSGKCQIHICFDNVYFDKSWSFQKRPREVHLSVSIRNITTLKQTNYNNYAKHFIRISSGDAENTEDSGETNYEFTENDFNKAVEYLQTLLNEVSEELRSSEGTLRTLQSLEVELRNVNESIFESFTRTSLMIIATICVFGLAQLAYIHFFLKRRKLL
ncbi:emp24/gp25L/p24 family/GOLD [Metschnikowia aff. pulcherrima]|uniref:Emp24/gp25L/p24 family/GOLD n=1 Tax=Metschnikowia aff. pulcherrima TaxID=2163413 RepID=A0A4P6XF39_9ASCO|nr:emp24/gp25L/p24 family/GOLD [Metschnikowia aff. pulcherrima]